MFNLIALRQNPFFRYLAPFAVFLLLSTLQDAAPAGEIYWLLYAAKIALVLLAVAFCFHGHWREIQGTFDPWAVAVGLGVLVLWIANYHLMPRAARNEAPFDPSALPLYSATLVIGVKLLGSSLVIPLVEELVWRSFLMRVLIKNDFLSVPLGRYTHFSFWFAALTFAAMHPLWQWGAALAAAVAYGFYLVMTKNLVGCMIAHGVTNLGLGIYVLATKTWELWV